MRPPVQTVAGRSRQQLPSRRFGLIAPAENHPAAEGLAPGEITTDLRTSIVNRTLPRNGIQGDARTVTLLLETAHAGVFNHEFFGDVVPG
jgi:hypothetical protein